MNISISSQIINNLLLIQTNRSNPPFYLTCNLHFSPYLIAELFSCYTVSYVVLPTLGPVSDFISSTVLSRKAWRKRNSIPHNIIFHKPLYHLLKERENTGNKAFFHSPWHWKMYSIVPSRSPALNRVHCSELKFWGTQIHKERGTLKGSSGKALSFLSDFVCFSCFFLNSGSW